jgi:hypothetical protein
MTKQQQRQQQALHTPLLGDECYDVNDTNTKAQESSPQSHLVERTSDNRHDVDDHLSQVDIIFPFNFLIVWIVMPLFLFLQFGFAFSHQHANNEEEAKSATPTTASVSWSTVNVNICLFVLTVWLYRQACIDSRTTNPVLLLLPETMTNIVLAILVFDVHKTIEAFVALLVGIQLMSQLALVATIHCFYCSRNKNNIELMEDEQNDLSSMEKQVDLCIV